MDEQKYQKLVEYINKNYSSDTATLEDAQTPDDGWEYGIQRGISEALWDIANILGLKIEPLPLLEGDDRID